MRINRDGFGRFEVLLILLIISIVAFVFVVGYSGWNFWHNHTEDIRLSVTVGPYNPEVNNVLTMPSSEEIFTGSVTSDSCAHSANIPIGDVGCSIAVDKQINVAIVHGNAYVKSWGKIFGFSPTQDITGKQVEVKAYKNGLGSYSISSPGDYISLLN